MVKVRVRRVCGGRNMAMARAARPAGSGARATVSRERAETSRPLQPPRALIPPCRPRHRPPLPPSARTPRRPPHTTRKPRKGHRKTDAARHTASFQTLFTTSTFYPSTFNRNILEIIYLPTYLK